MLNGVLFAITPQSPNYLYSVQCSVREMGQINECEEEVGSWVCGSRWTEFILRLGVCLPDAPKGP